LANISITGGTSPSIGVYLNNLGTSAGVGVDTVGSTNVSGTVTVANSTTALSESIKPLGVDTINLGSGSDTIVATGQASVASVFNNALLDGQTLVGNTGTTAGVTVANARTDVATVIGGALDTAKVTAQNGITDVSGVFSGVKADVKAVAGTAGLDTMSGGAARSTLASLGSDATSQHTIGNFVSGAPLVVDGYSLSYLAAHPDVSTQGGNTVISIDGGKTSIELKGFTGLSGSESTTHKI
jgi:hypothetical protein